MGYRASASSGTVYVAVHLDAPQAEIADGAVDFLKAGVEIVERQGGDGGGEAVGVLSTSSAISSLAKRHRSTATSGEATDSTVGAASVSTCM